MYIQIIKLNKIKPAITWSTEYLNYRVVDIISQSCVLPQRLETFAHVFPIIIVPAYLSIVRARLSFTTWSRAVVSTDLMHFDLCWFFAEILVKSHFKHLEPWIVGGARGCYGGQTDTQGRQLGPLVHARWLVVVKTSV